MNIKRNIIVEGKHKRSIPVDAFIPDFKGPKPVVLFAHGFKGFKDWGIWDLIAEKFVEAGFVFLKFNFSHNGTSPENLVDFVDLEAFGQNNYTLELQDLDAVLNALEEKSLVDGPDLDLDRLTLIGHSRGGGITAVKAARDQRIHSWIGWASVKDLAYAWRGNQELIANWEKTGVYEIMNGRTKQLMPLYYQLYEDFSSNEEEYSVERAIGKLQIPLLVVHGTADPAVPFSVTDSFKKWNPTLEVFPIPDADHVFGGRHPNLLDQLPEHASILVKQSISFIKNQ